MDLSSDHHEYCTGGLDPEDIVISGIAGRFPECDNVGELQEALFSKKDLIVSLSKRSERGLDGFPYEFCGLIRNLDKFDADFFRVSPTSANKTDPGGRIHMEVIYEAIADAGFEASELAGQNIGIFNAMINADSFHIRMKDKGFGDHNYTRGLQLGRASFAFDFRGPCVCMDTACSSSAVAFWTAVNTIKAGNADAAIVSGCQVNLDPEIASGYVKFGITSKTGHCWPYDANTDGMVRSEAITAIFLQKAKIARRVYANVSAVHFRSAGRAPRGLVVPSVEMEKKLMMNILNEAKVDFNEIEYVETHGTGTKVGDPIEVKALSEVFLENRSKPLLIGTIKSSIGHTEAASGICGMIKAILAFENDKIPPNIKFHTPNPNCPAILDGRIVVVTEPTPLKANYIPVTSAGISGSVVQILLKKNPITHSNYGGENSLPRLVLFPATTEEAVSFLFDYIRNAKKLSDEFFALLNKLSFTDPSFKPFRGYALFKEGENALTQIKQVSARKRKIWFIMSGMGCHWRGMGLELMQINEFAKSILRSAEVLKPYGIDLLKVLEDGETEPRKKRNITASFIGICAVQIALIDVLKLLDIKADGFVGHSTGELACAYADGCCTAEETILAAYFRGQSVENTNLPEGGMAVVGLSWNNVKKICPKDVYAVCDNADGFVTISGLKEPLETFVETLKQQNIFVHKVDVHGYSFHCEHVLPIVPALREAMNKIITDPKPRSERWISSSYPESEWDKPECKTFSGEYFVHNLMSSVLFKDAVKTIPPDAVVIEVAPHFILQSLVKNTVGPEASYFCLMKRNAENSVKFFMETLGKLYVDGVNPKIEKLYPPVKFPVPRGTPMISDLIRWNHSESYFVPKFTPSSRVFSREFDLFGTDAYLLQHKVVGQAMFPASGYIYLAWETLASNKDKNFEEMPVVIERLKIHKATIITQQAGVKFSVNILDSSGRFEITEGKSVVASGRIYERKHVPFQESSPEYDYNAQSISGEEMYDEIKRRGYEYGPAFQSILEVNIEGTSGIVQWKDKWIPFLDTFVSFSGLNETNDEQFLPKEISFFKIDPIVLKKAVQSDNSSYKKEQNAFPGLPMKYNKKTRICRSVGVELVDMTAVLVSRPIKSETPILEECKFVPYITVQDAANQSLQKIRKYFNRCNVLMNEIGKAWKKDIEIHRFIIENSDENILEETAEEDVAENHHLLKNLKSLLGASNITNELVTSYMQSIGTDILNNALVNEETLRILLDIIFENSFRKLSVIEINNAFPVVTTIASDIVEKYNYMPFKKNFLVANGAIQLDEELLEKHRIQVLSKDKLNYMVKNEEDSRQDIVISSFMCGPLSKLKELLHTLTSVIRKNGFILLFFKEKANSGELFLSTLCGEELQIQSQSTLEEIIQEENLVILSKISDSLGCSVYLLRSPCLIEPQKVLLIEDDDYNWVKNIKQELFEKNSGRVWLIAEKNRMSGIVGMMKCLIKEPGGERVRCIFISPTKAGYDPPLFSLENPYFGSLFTKDLTLNVWRDGSWGSFRHIPIKQVKVPRLLEHSYVKCLSFGNLSSFQWMESRNKYIENTNGNLFHVYYAALNFKNVMIATGKLPAELFSKNVSSDAEVCFEFSGREDGTGRRVCGVGIPALATSVLTDQVCLIEVPDQWTLEEAATVPIVYSTSYYSLIIKARLMERQSILIHSGTGGVGQAAINIALSMNCEIYTTVGTTEKKEYLRRKYPQIKEENIGCSRDISFEKMIMERTDGRGVDVVLNSLAEDKFHASMRCVAQNGCFVEIGKFDIAMDNEIGLKLFSGSMTFIGVSLDLFFEAIKHDGTEREAVKEIMNLLRNGIRTGVVKPLDRTVFDKDSPGEAFRYMTKGTHIGKVLIKIRDEEKDRLSLPNSLKQLAVPDTLFYYNKVYIVIGGLGGFGMEVAKWIAKKGGRNLILTSRYGARTPYHFYCLKRWVEQGINVQVSTLNVAIRNEAEKLLKDASHIGPVGGIFNSALILKDALMRNQTTQSFKDVCESKAPATKYLDDLSRELCTSLDHFVCFSSMSGGRGNVGQTNYGFANSVMEMVCEQRKRDGLPGLAIQWGFIGEVGFVHRSIGDDIRISGYLPQSVQSCLETLDAFCQQDCPVVSSYKSSQQVETQKEDLKTQIGKLLGIDIASVDDPTKTLEEIGLDSFGKVELKNLIHNYADLNLTDDEVQKMTVEDIKTLLNKIHSQKTDPSSVLASEDVKLPPVFKHKEPLLVVHDNIPGDPIFIVNIGYTDVNSFRHLAVELQRPTFAVVWTDDVPRADVQELASWYLKLIQKRVKGPFHIVGYSLGGSVAFEMALQSDKCEGNLKTITLFNGSDDLLNALSNDVPKMIDYKVLALCRFVEQFTSGHTTKLKNELLNEKDQDQRIQMVLRHLTDSSHQSVDKNELLEAITCYLQKQKLIQSYTPSGKLSMDISIIESSTKMLPNDVARVKELFVQVCSGNVSIHREIYSNQFTKQEEIKKIARILQKTTALH